MEWETVDDWTERSKVPGGWFVKINEPVFHMTESREGDGWDWRIALTFYPDTDHQWEILPTEDGK